MAPRPGGDQFRNLAEVLEPDPRQGNLVIPTTDAEAFRGRELRDVHRSVAEAFLHDGVPDDVWIQFETARNLWLYSWFVYRFSAVAELVVYASLERALHLACIDRGVSPPRGLGALMSLAVKARWINALAIQGYRSLLERNRHFREHLQAVQPDVSLSEGPDPEAYLQAVQNALRALRNEYAHGDPLLTGYGAQAIRLCADTINQLFHQP